MSEVIQVQLENGSSRMTCYLPTAKRFKPGDSVTLKNSEHPDKLWRIEWISGMIRDSKDLPTGWDNNI